jgi:PAS domain S-box-containing protein
MISGPILCVDDEPTNLALLRKTLKDDYSLVYARTGTECLQAVEKHRPALILLDVQLPDLDGYAVCRRLKARPETADIPVIFVTGHTSETDEQAGFAAGGVDYVTKPVRPAIVKARVRAQLSLVSANRLRAQLRLTQAITDCAAESIFVTDDQGRVTFMNAEAERAFGFIADELAGRVLHDVIHHHYPDGRPFPYAECPNCEMLRIGEVIRNHESVYFCKDGSTLTVSTSSAPLEIDGQMRGLVLVIHDITELKRAAISLHDADRRKDEFLAMLAHELRNPLAPIRNATHILGRLDTGDPQVQWAQRIIEQQVTHLTRMVDDLLDVSRIVSGKIVLKPEVIDLAEVIRQVIEGARPLIDAKGHWFQLDLPAAPLWVHCDEVRLSQVLVNLIDNAVKYTPSHGRIRLSAEDQGDWIEILLDDNGIGIPASLLPHVFDLFQQEHRALDRTQGGLGLGLTLVQRMVNAHGGRVVAESEGTGCGTRMRVSLPRSQVDPAAPPPVIPESAAHDASPLRILVVDDEAAVADSTALVLRLEGNQVQVARDGPTALQLAEVFQPQVVLLDIGLGGMDGYETARRLRAGPQGAILYLIAISGYGDAQARERGREAGFDLYLVKPVEPEELKRVLAKAHNTH